ncbi:trypsin-like serine peptidase [Streptomyces avermitilis]
MSTHVTEVPSTMGLDVTLEELANAEPLLASEAMPEDIKEMLKPHPGLYIRSDDPPALDVEIEPVPGAPGMWRLARTEHGTRFMTTIPGGEQIGLDPEEARVSLADGEPAATESYRPPWLDMEFLPRLVPFHMSSLENGMGWEATFMEPRAMHRPSGTRATEGPNIPYPFSCVGKVFSHAPGIARGGTGFLVGPDLMMTAGHVAPWGGSPWSMEFIPGMRGTERPFGSSFVSNYRGWNTRPEVSGYDYVICKLFTPLGNGLGHFGTRSFGSEDEYYRRFYLSSGYPDTFQRRPALELDITIVDIDNDSPGLELEIPLGHPLTAGWSGGPMWLPAEGPTVVGVHSGNEKDGFDPRRNVEAGGRAMVDLVLQGL